MIYAMPGMVSQLYLQADRPATMFGQSAHFSGDGSPKPVVEDRREHRALRGDIERRVGPRQFGGGAGANIRLSLAAAEA